MNIKNTVKYLFSLLLLFLFACSSDDPEFKLVGEFITTNSMDWQRTDEIISIPLGSLQISSDDINNLVVTARDEEIPSQLFDENGDEYYDVLLALLSYAPNESVKISIYNTDSVNTNYKSRVYAELAIKEGYEYVDGKYEGGKYRNVERITVPKQHTEHDNLFKYEGPGWESDKVGYRFYLDRRNTIDIFGKKTNELVLSGVGRYDLTVETHSYHEMSDWGMDIFKVGNSLGLGSIATLVNDEVVKISETDSIVCTISDNGPLLAAVNTGYYGWNTGTEKVNLNSRLSITAGSRLTRVDIQVSGGLENITTGIAKNENAIEFIRSNHKRQWQYISIYGEQALSEDNLGIVVFFDENNFVKHGEDELNHYVVLKPIDGYVTYYFAAVWEQELNGIDNRTGFIDYMQKVKHNLNNPVQIIHKEI